MDLGRQVMVTREHKSPFEVHGQKFKMKVANVVDVFKLHSPLWILAWSRKIINLLPGLYF